MKSQLIFDGTFHNLVDFNGEAFDIAPENTSDLFEKLKLFLEAENRNTFSSYAFMFRDKSASPDLGILSLDNRTKKLDVLFLQAKRFTSTSNNGVSLNMVKEEHQKYTNVISNCDLVRN